MKTAKHKAINKQQGAVSFFIVIFTALLLTTITISFAQLMMRDQQQTTYSDLSESAYDSAMAGVEDAKRALLMQQDCIGSDTESCDIVSDAIGAEQCDTLARIFGGNASDETEIRQHEGDRRLEQAYTCVKITPNTGDYLGTIESANTATLIPLRGTDSFDRVVVSWSLSKGGGTIDLPESESRELPRNETSSAAWPDTRPALLRAQFINGGGGFNLTNLNSSGRSNTLFLYPSRAGSNDLSFTLDTRREGAPNMPQLVVCGDARQEVESGTYACEVELDIGSVIPGGQQAAFLNLAAFYRPTDYRIELRMGDRPVQFAGVQPQVDSTGRANDLFRRVISRVELGNTFSYPVAALETSGNLCKNFSITTDESNYINNCVP